MDRNFPKLKEMKVVRVLFGLFCILSLIHAVRIEAQTLSEVEREHPARHGAVPDTLKQLERVYRL